MHCDKIYGVLLLWVIFYCSVSEWALFHCWKGPHYTKTKTHFNNKNIRSWYVQLFFKRQKMENRQMRRWKRSINPSGYLKVDFIIFVTSLGQFFGEAHISCWFLSDSGCFRTCFSFCVFDFRHIALISHSSLYWREVRGFNHIYISPQTSKNALPPLSFNFLSNKYPKKLLNFDFLFFVLCRIFGYRNEKVITVKCHVKEGKRQTCGINFFLPTIPILWDW